MANFYRDTDDLVALLAHVPWDALVPNLEDEFALASEGGPASLLEAREIHEAVLDLVGEIAGDVVAPTAADVDRMGTTLVDGRVRLAPATQVHLAALRDAGLMGFVIDRRFGGQNLPTTLYTASVEIVSRACASLMNLYALQACGETIQNFGSEELARRFVPGVASGELSTCMSLSEPDAGSALGSVATKAVAVDEARGLFRLTGTKIFSTNGGADLILVLARTEEGSNDARGLSLFAVPRSDRVVVTKIEEKLGLHGSPTCALALDGAEGWLIGERRRGLTRYVMALIHGARLEVAAQAIGIAQGALHATVRYVRERRQFGRAIEDFAPVRQQVLEMETRVRAARRLTYRTAEVVDRLRGLGRMLRAHPADPRVEAWRAEQKRLSSLEDLLTPLAKYAAAEWGNEVCYRALQLHGGYGYCRDYGIERRVRDVRVTNLYEGTSEIQVGGVVGLLVSGGVDELRIEMEKTIPGTGVDPESRRRFDAVVAAARAAAAHLSTMAHDKALLQLRARPMADLAADLVAGAEFLRHAAIDVSTAVVGKAFLGEAEQRSVHALDLIRRGDRTALDAYEAVVRPYRR